MIKHIIPFLFTLLFVFILTGCNDQELKAPDKIGENEQVSEMETDVTVNKTEQSYLENYLGDWYGQVTSNETDGTTKKVSVHVHVKEVGLDESGSAPYIRGTIYHSPKLVGDSFHTEHDLKGSWSEEEELFYIGLGGSGDETFVLSNTDSDIAILKTWGDVVPGVGDIPYELEMSKMKLEDIQKEKNEYQQWADSMTEISNEKRIPAYLEGAWSGVIPDQNTGDYMGFQLNFTNVSDVSAEGELKWVQNEGKDPNYGYGTRYSFIATLDETGESLILDFSPNKFNFSFISSTSAIYHSEYGDIPLTKE